MSGDREKHRVLGMDDDVAKPINPRERAAKLLGLIKRHKLADRRAA